MCSNPSTRRLPQLLKNINWKKIIDEMLRSSHDFLHLRTCLATNICAIFGDLVPSMRSANSPGVLGWFCVRRPWNPRSFLNNGEYDQDETWEDQTWPLKIMNEENSYPKYPKTPHSMSGGIPQVDENFQKSNRTVSFVPKWRIIDDMEALDMGLKFEVKFRLFKWHFFIHQFCLKANRYPPHRRMVHGQPGTGDQ